MHIKSIISKHILQITFLNEPELIFFYTQLSSFKYSYQIQTILINIDYLCSHLIGFKDCYVTVNI